jgi:hypothetical protein
LLLEMPNPFKSRGAFSEASGGDAALHTVSVRAHRHAEVCNRPHGGDSWPTSRAQQPAGPKRVEWNA